MNQENKFKTCAMISLGVLLSVYRGMGLHSYISQAGLESYCGMCLKT